MPEVSVIATDTAEMKAAGYRLYDFTDPAAPLRELERAAYNTLALPVRT